MTLADVARSMSGDLELTPSRSQELLERAVNFWAEQPGQFEIMCQAVANVRAELEAELAADLQPQKEET